MRVLGAGFSRTGTLSLRAALERLGFGPCYHMFELMRRPEHVTTWQAAADGDRVDWRDVLGDYRSAVDLPTWYFWRELSVAYPEAKVILTVRDPYQWYDSQRRLDQSMRRLWEENPDIAPVQIAQLVRQIAHRETFSDRLDDRDHCINVFRRHMDQVVASIAADRLLVFDVKAGWEPLCAFLGVDVPQDEPFPHLNAGDSVIDHALAALRGRTG